MNHSCLIIEGGGFKTGFTAGILDAFMISNYRPFQQCIGISGGSVALSYFLSGQYRYCLNAMRRLAKEEQFTDYKRTFGERGYMDIDFIAKVASEVVPFDLDKALEVAQDLDIAFVATDIHSGAAAYLQPDKANWIDAVVASSTLPLVTKGRHQINGIEYFDGGWSDPLPVEWAYQQGARDILILRTWPSGVRSSQSWTDYFGSLYYNDMPGLKNSFSNCYKKYNESLDFIAAPPSDLKLVEIAPKKLLKSGTYTYSNKTIMSDYRYGLDRGLMHVHKSLGS